MLVKLKMRKRGHLTAGPRWLGARGIRTLAERGEHLSLRKSTRLRASMNGPKILRKHHRGIGG